MPPLYRFIPLSRQDVIRLCLTQQPMTAEDQKQFQSLSKLLSHHFHYEYHQTLEALKADYASLDPDRDTAPLNSPTAHSPDVKKRFAEQLEQLVNAANFEAITQQDLELALLEESLISLRLQVNFDDFERVIFYGRGARQETQLQKKWFGLQQREFTFTVYERVAIYFQVKDESYFEGREVPLGLTPGACLLKLFRNVPKADLEMLFPNTQVRMRTVDKLLIGIPAAVSGGVVVATKLGGTLLLIGSLISFWLGLRNQPVIIDQTALLALGAGLAALGGFLWKQYSKFKNRKIHFMKTLADNLYFRNLDNNAGVFYRLIDDAEEEDVKEALLAYFLLWRKPDITVKELDDEVEAWLLNEANCKIDFEIKDALAKLARLDLVLMKNGRLQAIAPGEAIKNLDQRWDNFFSHA